MKNLDDLEETNVRQSILLKRIVMMVLVVVFLLPPVGCFGGMVLTAILRTAIQASKAQREAERQNLDAPVKQGLGK